LETSSDNKIILEEEISMGWKSIWWKAALVLATAGVVLAGCAHTGTLSNTDQERVLAAAGFQVKFADTPEKLEHLKTLPQKKIFVKAKDGKDHYVYADASSCKCIYVGDEKAYQRAQQLAARRELDKEDIEASEMYRDSAEMNWGLWGPWRPWY
jgi:hypothetical protein